MHLNLFIQSRGHHEASWRHPKSSKLPLTDIRYTVEQAHKAESGLFDSIFLADVLGLWTNRKRLELAVRAQSLAVKACCEDARTHGLLIDPRIKTLAQVIPAQALEKMSKDELEMLIRLLEGELQHVARGDAVRRNEGPFFTVRIEDPNNNAIKRVTPPSEALQIISRANGHKFTIRDTRGIEITEYGLRQLVEQEKRQTKS